MTKLRYLTKEGFRNLRVNKPMTAASITVLISCLLMVGVAFMLLINIEAFISGIEQENVIMVYADTEISGYDFIRLGQQIQKIDNVEYVEAIKKEDAYQEMLTDINENVRDYLKSIDENPLPDAYKITVSDMTKFTTVVDSVKTLNNVLRVRENSNLAQQLSAISDAVQYISLGVIILLLLASVFIISNTIKITMYSRQLEISIMKSVGATKSFIRWPFMVEGMIIGVIAGLITTLCVWGIYEIAMNKLFYVFSTFGNSKMIPFMDYAAFLATVFVVSGVFTGVFGSATSVRRYLKERKFIELEE